MIINSWQFDWNFSNILFKVFNRNRKKRTFSSFYCNSTTIFLLDKQQIVCRLHQKQELPCSHALNTSKCEKGVYKNTKVYFKSFCMFNDRFRGCSKHSGWKRNKEWLKHSFLFVENSVKKAASFFAEVLLNDQFTSFIQSLERCKFFNWTLVISFEHQISSCCFCSRQVI